jgi:hypothetical protein
MTAKEFAEKYNGATVKDNGSGSIGVIVGYVAGSVCVCIQFENTTLPKWKIGEVSAIIFDERKVKHFTRIMTCDLTVIKEVEQPKLYPHTCKVCHSSARRIKQKFICSNVKCKTWKKIRAIAAQNIVREIDKDGFVICPECKGLARDTNGLSNRFNRRNICVNGHKWNSEWRHGYKIKCFSPGYADTFYEELTNIGWVTRRYDNKQEA